MPVDLFQWTSRTQKIFNSGGNWILCHQILPQKLRQPNKKKHKPTKKSASPTAGNIASTQDFFVKQKRVLRQTPIFVRLKLQYRKSRPSQDISEWGKFWFPNQFLITYPTAPAAGHKLKAPTHCFKRGTKTIWICSAKLEPCASYTKQSTLKLVHFTDVHAEENIENCSVVSRLNRYYSLGVIVSIMVWKKQFLKLPQDIANFQYQI